jgi:hypothetical protein
VENSVNFLRQDKNCARAFRKLQKAEAKPVGPLARGCCMGKIAVRLIGPSGRSDLGRFRIDKS